ncbi:hypothetical protein LCGC14_1909300 [marine sediment metagenome]|uniref:Terminase large subunit gp17-like C-terminal domain-containing protein n=1 Tax=marine sediment metagenome TaxID=412755 RepID=A0A0F9FUN3_9ZZZZ
MLINTPFEHHVPTGMRENLMWRAKTHRRVLEDPSYSEVLRGACAVDPIFYVNGFLYTYDPRLEPFRKIPFILYPFQRDGLLETFKAIGNEDLLIEKTRDMGASWLAVVAFEYLWHFKKLMSFLMVSSKEEFVDKSGNPKTLFWKIDFIHQNLPSWLMPKGYDINDHRMKLHIENPETGSVIDGESTTGEVARGDRRTSILLDEFAKVEQGHRVLSATRDVTRSRLFNSTPNGINNAYYSIRQSSIKKLRFFWVDHPEKSIGLYKIDSNGNLEISDKKRYPKDYNPFEQKWREKLDGCWRSPWFDNECKRAATWQEISQEILIDYLGSGHQFFSSNAIEDVIKQYSIPEISTGDLEYDALTGETIEFRKNEKGKMRLWVSLDREGKMTREHKYVVACDISAGTGSSNSVICAYDVNTLEKVLEYANPYIRPEEMAKQAYAIANWLYNALLIWESNGVGRQFGSRVVELSYGNIYYRKREEAITKKETLIPGWHSSKETKLVLLGEYRLAVEKKRIINKSELALRECLEYIFNKQGGVSHSKEDNADDPTGAKDNHGDRVIADALAWRGMNERNVVLESKEPKIPIGSLAWRRELQKRIEEKPIRELSRSNGW